LNAVVRRSAGKYRQLSDRGWLVLAQPVSDRHTRRLGGSTSGLRRCFAPRWSRLWPEHSVYLLDRPQIQNYQQILSNYKIDHDHLSGHSKAR